MWKFLAVVFVLSPAAAGAQPPDGGIVDGPFIPAVASDYKNFLSLDTARTVTLGAVTAGGMHAADETIANWVQETNPGTLTGGATYGSQLVQVPVAAAWWMIAAAAGSSRHAAAGRDLLRAQISVVSWT